MSYVLATPEALAAAASDLDEIGSTLHATNVATAVSTTRIAAAAADEISTRIAAIFSSSAQRYQRLSTQAALLHNQFARALASGATSYAAAEANAVSALTDAADLFHTAAAIGGGAIENLYLAVEPWVQYGFNLASYALGWLPLVGILAPQINFFYYLYEPIAESVLFNGIDFLTGTVAFSQGLSNIWAATTASVNQFVNTEIHWLLNFLPPFPPLGTAFPAPPL